MHVRQSSIRTEKTDLIDAIESTRMANPDVIKGMSKDVQETLKKSRVTKENCLNKLYLSCFHLTILAI